MATLFTDEELRKNESLFVEFCERYNIRLGNPVFDLIRGLMITSDPAEFITGWLQNMVDVAPRTFPTDGMPR